MAECEVHRWSVGGGEVSTSLGSFEDRSNYLFEDDARNCRGRGGGGDGEAMDTKRIGAEGLFEAIHFFSKLVDGGILLVYLLAEGGVLVHELANRLLQHIDLGKLAAE